MAKEEHAIHDQTNILTGRRLIVLFCGLASALLISFIDQQSIGVVLPTIGKELGSSSTIVWAGTSSMIANTAFQVLYGRLSDIFGRKVVLLTCLCLLGVGDILCGFAKSGPQLYAFRGISGVANGGIMALSMMIVSDVTTLQQRGKYQGILGACVGLGNCIGPFLAAGFTRSVSWRATFHFIAPIAVIIAVILFFLLPKSKIPSEPLGTKLVKIDYLGIVFSACGTILILIPISGIGTQFKASSPEVTAMLTIGCAFMVLFMLNEWKLAKLPMFPPRLFKNPALAAMLIQNFLIGLVYYSYMYFLPIFFQAARRETVLGSAALILPMVIPQAVASTASGQYISRVGRYGEVLWAGYVSWVVGVSVQCIFSRTFPMGGIVVVLMLQGIGAGFTFQPTLVAAQAHSPKPDRAVVISSRNFLRSLGGSVGLAIGSAIFSNTIVHHISADIPTASANSIRASVFEIPDVLGLTSEQQAAVEDLYARASQSVFYFWCGVMALCLLLTFLIRDKGLMRKEEKQEQGPEESSPSSGDEETPAVKEGKEPIQDSRVLAESPQTTQLGDSKSPV